MLGRPIPRRKFLLSSFGALGVASAASVVGASSPAPLAPGSHYAYASRGGLGPGTGAAPSRGDAFLLDGRRVPVTNGSGSVAPGKGLLLAQEVDGSWAVLYAEV